MQQTRPKPAPSQASLAFENRLRARGFSRIAGVDEAGRGPLAGPVAAAAVILDPARPIEGLADSKLLKEARREELFEEITRKARVGAAFVSAREIDTSDIRKASLLAMKKSVASLAVCPDFVLIDGRDVPPGLPCPGEAIIDGDALSASIAAASIIAKVLRDRLMKRMETAFPGYGFGKHAGYGTAVHKAAIATLGPCRLHRLSFAPFRNGTHYNL